jgi:hypothetical protein
MVQPTYVNPNPLLKLPRAFPVADGSLAERRIGTARIGGGMNTHPKSWESIIEAKPFIQRFMENKRHRPPIQIRHDADGNCYSYRIWSIHRTNHVFAHRPLAELTMDYKDAKRRTDAVSIGHNHHLGSLMLALRNVLLSPGRSQPFP